MESKTTVFIVDDHPIFRRGLRDVIEADCNYRVVGEAEDGATALAQIKVTKPRLALLDIDIPKMNGLQVARELRSIRPPVAVIMLTLHAEENMFNAAMDAGAHGYILKENAVQDVILALKAVSSGGLYLSHSISGYLIRRNHKISALQEKKTGLQQLTATERRVLRLVAENMTNKQIGQELFISHRTVEAHRAHILAKLELQGNRALFQFALEHRGEL
jgi:DNA-binding NarL/FixJ family response regulator